jgi:hypothetical protein
MIIWTRTFLNSGKLGIMVSAVDDALEYNKQALVTVWTQLSGATVPSSPRNDLVWTYISIEHFIIKEFTALLVRS